MSDKTAKQIAEFIKPLQAKPGSEIDVAKDLDPRYSAGMRKRDGVELLRTGVALLSEYQDRLAAYDAQQEPEENLRGLGDPHLLEQVAPAPVRPSPGRATPADRPGDGERGRRGRCPASPC